jgi:rubrerythrin
MGLLSRLFGTTGQSRDLVSDLLDDYRAEASQAVHLRSHAERARYPQVAERLRALAEVEERHAGLLRDHILGLGGGIPPVAPEPLIGRNQWERAVAVRMAAQAKRRRLIEHATHWDPEEPTAARILAKIYDEDAETLSAYDDVIVRSDPHALD